MNQESLVEDAPAGLPDAVQIGGIAKTTLLTPIDRTCPGKPGHAAHVERVCRAWHVTSDGGFGQNRQCQFNQGRLLLWIGQRKRLRIKASFEGVAHESHCV